MIQETNLEQAKLTMIKLIADSDDIITSMILSYDEEKNCLWIDYDFCEDEKTIDKIREM